MKSLNAITRSLVVCLLSLLVFAQEGTTQQSTVSGQVRLSGGLPVAGAQVMLFDLVDLRRGPVTRAATDESGHFVLPLAALGGAFALPEGFVLGANYPNPFNPSTIIPYELAATTQVRLEVFNTLGQRMATLVDGEQGVGTYSVQWDGTDATGQAVAAGMYLYRLTVDGVQQTGRMMLVDGQAGIPMGAGSVAAQPMAEGSSPAYGLVVSGPGMVAYVDADFGVEVGMESVDIQVEAWQNVRMKVTSNGILGDVNNNGQVDTDDGLLVAAYVANSSTSMPNNGDISLGDVNCDDQVDLTDARLITTYVINPSDSAVQSLGIGRAEGCDTPVGPLPDLAIDPKYMGVDYSTPDAGETIELYLDVENSKEHASASSPQTYLYYYLSEDATFSPENDIFVHSTEVPPLPLPAEAKRGNWNYRQFELEIVVPSNISGTYYYIACVDPENNVEESKEDNNCASVRVDIGGIGSVSDLVVENPQLTSNRVSPGSQITFSVTVRNTGSNKSPETRLNYYRRYNNNNTWEKIDDDGSRVRNIDVGGSSPESEETRVPSDLGTYYYRACIGDTYDICSPEVAVEAVRVSSDVLFSDDFSSGNLSKWTTQGGGSGSIEVENEALKLVGTAGDNYTVVVSKEIFPTKTYANYVLSFDWKVTIKETPYGITFVRALFYNSADERIGQLIALNAGDPNRSFEDHGGHLGSGRHGGVFKKHESFGWERVTINTSTATPLLNMGDVHRIEIKAEVYNDAGRGGDLYVDNLSFEGSSGGSDDPDSPRLADDHGDTRSEATQITTSEMFQVIYRQGIPTIFWVPGSVREYG